MKNKFIKSTIILIIGGIITKLLGMIIRITLTRLLKDGIFIYSLIMPTFSLFIAIAQAGMPSTISKLVAEEKRNNKNLVFSIIPISLLINSVIMIIIIISSKYIATYLLHNTYTYYPIMCISFVLPFISISSILRGYFFGKQMMFPHILSNAVEDIIRLITLIIGIPIFLKYSIIHAVSFVVLSNIISEITSILVLFIFTPKTFKLKKEDFKINKEYIKDTFSIAVPTTASRIIGNIGYFLEPIILTYMLLNSGYDNTYIVREYGIINSYVLPMLLLPSFFTNAISSALIPVISTYYVNKKILLVKKRIKEAIIFSLIVSLPVILFLFLFPSIPLKVIYRTNLGIDYLKVLSLIFIFSYVQAPIISAIQAMGYAKKSLNGTIIGVLSRNIFLIIFAYFNNGIYSLIYALSLSIIITTIYDIKVLKNIIKKGS